MKQIYILFGLLITFSSCIYSQNMNIGENKFEPLSTFSVDKYLEVEETIIKTIDDNLEIKSGEIKILYYPVYKEARIIFKCTFDTYKEDVALCTIRNTLIDFTIKKGFYHYTRLEDDVVKFNKDENGITLANYTTRVKFYK